MPKVGIEPTFDAYEASVLTIELPKLIYIYINILINNF